MAGEHTFEPGVTVVSDSLYGNARLRELSFWEVTFENQNWYIARDDHSVWVCATDPKRVLATGEKQAILYQVYTTGCQHCVICATIRDIGDKEGPECVHLRLVRVLIAGANPPAD